MKRALFCATLLLVAVPLLAAGPDLIIQSQKADPSTIGVGEDFKIEFTLKNAGTTAVASPAVKIPLPSGATYLSNEGTIPCVAYTGYVMCTVVAGASLNAGTTITGKFKLRAPSSAGPLAVWLEADPDKQISESSETNNKASVGGSFYVRPKLAAIRGSQPTAPRAVNEGYAVVLGLNNIGTVDVRYPGLKFTISGGSQPFVITGITNGTAVGAQLNVETNSQTFSWVPPGDKSPLKAGANTGATLFMKSPRPHTVTITAEVDSTTDNTVDDNKATATVVVQ